MQCLYNKEGGVSLVQSLATHIIKEEERQWWTSKVASASRLGSIVCYKSLAEAPLGLSTRLSTFMMARRRQSNFFSFNSLGMRTSKAFSPKLALCACSIL